MTLSVSVEADVKQLTKDLNDLQKKRVPFVANQAVNEVGIQAKKKAVKNVSRETKLTNMLINKRWDRQGEGKDRVEFRKANSRLRFATMVVYLHGIPLFQTKPTPKAGGKRGKGLTRRPRRFYKGAFWGKTKTGDTLTFKAFPRAAIQRKAEAGTHGRLFVPKIGVRKRLHKWYKRLTQGREGRAVFGRTFQKKLQIEFKKKGLA